MNGPRPIIDLPAPCPFCGSTRGVIDQIERFGTPPSDADPDEGWWSFSVRCTCCAAEGPWARNGAAAALRRWALRPAIVDGRPNLRPWGRIDPESLRTAVISFGLFVGLMVGVWVVNVLGAP